MVQSSMVLNGLYDILQIGTKWYGMMCGMLWCGIVWYGVVRYDMVE